MGGTIGTSHGVRLERTGEQAEAEDVWFNVWSQVWPFQIHQLCILSNDDDEATESRPVRAIKDIQPGKHSINSIQPTQSSVSSPSARPASVSSPSARPAALTVGKPSQNEAKMRRSSRNLRTMSVEAWKCHGTPPGTALARLVEKKIGGLQENTKRYTPPKTPLVCVFVCVSALSCLSPPLHPSTQDTHPLSLSLLFAFLFLFRTRIILNR